MARSALLLALLGLCSLAAASTSSTQLYSSIQPPTYNLTLTFTINGVSATPAPCNYTQSACLPLVEVSEADTILITYTGPATPNNTVSLMWCYAPPACANRAWRKASPTISKDKQCNVAKPFKTGLPTGSGSFLWTPSVNMAGSTYTIQLLELQAGSNPTTYAAMGKGPGYFTIVPINSTPGWLMALVGVFCAIGPITLAGYFVWEQKFKKA